MKFVVVLKSWLLSLDPKAAAVVVAAIAASFALMQLLYAVRTFRGRVLIELDDSYWARYGAVWTAIERGLYDHRSLSKYSPNRLTAEEYTIFEGYVSYFDRIGILLKLHLISKKSVFKLFPYRIFRTLSLPIIAELLGENSIAWDGLKNLKSSWQRYLFFHRKVRPRLQKIADDKRGANISSDALSEDTSGIRSVVERDELEQLRVLQYEIWDLPERFRVPLNVFIAASNGCGVVLSANDEHGSPVGFALAFFKRKQDQLSLYLHLLGVHPEFQNRKIGTRLMLSLKAFANENGIGQISWTFDPLELGNASLYLKNLRGTCGVQYLPNYYGEIKRGSKVQRTDRYEVVWDLFSPVTDCTSPGEPVVIIENGVPCLATYYGDAQVLYVDVPMDKRQLAKWSDTLRAAFDRLSKDRFVIHHFEKVGLDHESHGRYVFVKVPARHLPLPS